MLTHSFDVVRRLLIACALAGGAPLAAGAADHPDEPSTVVSDVHLFVVGEDGSVTEGDATVLRANTPAGIDEIAQRYVWFDRSVAKVDIVDAYAIDRDGVRHTVSPDQIREIQEPRSAGAPTFQDAKLKAVIFPGVGVGSSVYLRFHKSQSTPVVAGQFNYFVEPGRRPVESQTLIFDLPAGKTLYSDARGYVALPPVTENGRTRYEFRYSRLSFDRIENGAIAYANYGDRLMVSTFPDYASFAASYREPAADTSVNDPAIVNLARALTLNDPDNRAKAQTLYDWVRRNIRYVAFFIGQSPAIPHRAAEVLANRYGDCKDHVALYGALLAAAGIRSEPALISLGSVYSLPAVPGYGSGAINHVITWLPDLGLYADSTASSIEFGYLPLTDMDRPTLLVDSGTLSRTPATQPLSRTARLQIDVARDGGAAFSYRVEDAGWSAEMERTGLRGATAQRRGQIAADRLRYTNLRGTASLTTSELDANAGPLATTLRGTLDNVVWPTGTTALPALTSLSGGIATQVRSALSERVRTQPYVCVGGEFDEIAQIALPKGVRVVDLPDNAEVRSASFDFRSRYVLDPGTNVVQMTRRLRADFGKQVCTPADFDAEVAALKKMERDTQAQIIVKAAER
jgi:transglutaminase-like putative cysteine protease